MLLTLNRIETLTFPKVVIPFLLALLVAFPCLSRSLRLGHYIGDEGIWTLLLLACLLQLQCDGISSTWSDDLLRFL